MVEWTKRCLCESKQTYQAQIMKIHFSPVSFLFSAVNLMLEDLQCLRMEWTKSWTGQFLHLPSVLDNSIHEVVKNLEFHPYLCATELCTVDGRRRGKDLKTLGRRALAKQVALALVGRSNPSVFLRGWKYTKLSSLTMSSLSNPHVLCMVREHLPSHLES